MRLSTATDTPANWLVISAQTPTTTTAIVTGLSSNLTYYVRVRSVGNGASNGVKSDWSVQTGTIFSGAPASAVTIAAQTVYSNTRVTLSWSVPSTIPTLCGSMTYQVTWSNTTSGTYAAVVPFGSTNFGTNTITHIPTSFSGLTSPLWYKVAARTVCGDSTATATSHAYFVPPLAPSAIVQSLIVDTSATPQVAVTAGTIQVEWTAPTAVSGTTLTNYHI